MMNQVMRSAPNSSTEKEMIAMAEEELARLQRQLRIMEDDRMAFSDETSSKLEKQRRIIELLRKEKAKLCEDINVATCKNQKRKDKRLSKEIYKLLEVYEEYCERVRVEKEEIVEMDVQIKKLESDIKNLRPKSSVTENHFQTRLTSGQKTLQILKNRLDNMVKKFCAILATNKELREEINHLLKERNHFNDVWEKLLKDIHSGKRYMVDLIEQATIAFDQREEWCSKLDALKKRAEVDFVLHSEEMREIQRRLDQYMTLREFLCVKGQKRILKDLEEKERLKKEMQQQNLEDQLEVYETTLKKIQVFCKEEDVDRIAALFLKQEEENFALFNYVNELSHEIESLTYVMDELHEKIDDQIELSNERAKQRQSTISSLQVDLDEATKKAEEDEQEVQKAADNLQKVLNGIEKVFEIVNCDKGPILKLLGENASINLFNVKIYLGTIEKKLSGIITDLYFAEKSMLSHPKKIKTVLSPH
ncbi:outer dynein arm-docking complex subunit 1 [Anthonomus grandis grandis]|uniref:outer dynein arm-docking complex subunit 1 n=1 Tax=Anthonomus grandis grandis TaxID=2921223 RepID=UPI00216636A5|nr:outer dynein arm-docking complex subunit 1 [Anthonomus grandis grandis]